MELLQLRYFAEAAKLENISEAAKSQMVSQSSVSHAILRLERELGQELFVRSGWHVKLNQNGRQFYKLIKTALDNIDLAVSGAKYDNQKQINVVCLNMARLMPDLTAKFKEIHPEIHISLFLKKVKNFDLIIETLPYNGDEDYTHLFTERILVAVSVNSPLAQKEAVKLTDIKNIPVYGLKPGGNLEMLMLRYCAESGFRPRIEFTTSDTPFVLSSVENNAGVAFIPEVSWKVKPSAQIKLLPIEDVDCKRTLGIFTKKNVPLYRSVTIFKEFLIESFKNIL